VKECEGKPQRGNQEEHYTRSTNGSRRWPFGGVEGAIYHGNPLTGAPCIFAFPLAARVVQKEGQKCDKKKYLLMHAQGANGGGQVESVIAAAVMLSALTGMRIIRSNGSCSQGRLTPRSPVFPCPGGTGDFY